VRRLVTFGIVLVVVGLGGWAADNWARGRAEDQVAAVIQTRLGVGQKPEVTIGGFPFSLSFLTRAVPSARISAGSVPLTVSGKGVHVTGVLVDAERISLEGDQVRLARVTGTGVLSYGDLALISGVPTSSGGDGRLRLNYTARVGSQQFTLWVTAAPRLSEDGSSIELTAVRLEQEGTSARLSQAQLDRLAKPIPLKLPAGVRLTALTPSEGGVALAAMATGLSFTLS
jgi:hypothetical protein